MERKRVVIGIVEKADISRPDPPAPPVVYETLH